MDADSKRALTAVRAILDLADSNFPSATEIVIQALGQNGGSLKLPVYQMRRLLKDKDSE